MPALIGVLNFIQENQKKQLENDEVTIAIRNEEINPELVNYIEKGGIIKVVKSENYEEDLEKQKIKGYLELSKADGKTKVLYVFDQGANTSAGSIIKVQSYIEQFNAIKRSGILQQYNLNEDSLITLKYEQKSLQEIQNKPAQSGFVLFFLPYIILVGLIQGAAQFAIELTSGEKERNTLATTLSLNVSRTTIGLAKIAAILLLSFISLILNVTSILIAFKLFPGGFGGGTGGSEGINIGFPILFQIFIVLLPLSFLTAAVLVLMGTYARNQKEAGVYLLPLMLGSVFIGFTAQAFDVNTPTYFFAVPLLGHVAMIKQILLNSFNPLNFGISAVSTIILFIIILLVTVNMFKREEVIFRQ